jgi:hypothetical protein
LVIIATIIIVFSIAYNYWRIRKKKIPEITEEPKKKKKEDETEPKLDEEQDKDG